MLRFQCADFRNRDLKVAQDFQQKGFEFGVGLVYFVNQQNRRLVREERLQQRPWQQKAIREKDPILFGYAFDRFLQVLGTLKNFADFVLEDLGVKKLLGVLPLIERLGFIEPFIALEPNQFHS